MRVAAPAGAFAIDNEAAEARNLDLFSAAEAVFDDFQHGIHGFVGLPPGKSDTLVDYCHEIGLGHELQRTALKPELLDALLEPQLSP